MMSCIKIVTGAIQKINTRDQGKIKIAILVITTYASILMHLYKHYKICSVLQERLKYVQYPSKIPWTLRRPVHVERGKRAMCELNRCMNHT